MKKLIDITILILILYLLVWNPSPFQILELKTFDWLMSTQEPVQDNMIVLVDIDEVYMHCAKSIIRSKLWDNESQIDRKTFPSLGEIFADQIGGDLKAEDVNKDIKSKYKDQLY